MQSYPGNGYGSCFMCNGLFLKSNGVLSCSCMIGYHAKLGDVAIDNVGAFFDGETLQHIRNSFRDGREPFKICSVCLSRNSYPVLPENERRITLHVEPSNRCNLFCEACICTQERQSSAPPERRNLELRLFEKTLMELAAANVVVDAVALVGFGEPLLNLELASFALLGRKYFPDATIYIDTNANFPEQRAEELANCGLDKINLALDGVDQESYVRYRRDGKFDKALRFAAALAKAIRRSGSQTKPIWKYILFRWNDRPEQLAKARQMAADIGVEIQFHLTIGQNASALSSREVAKLNGGEAPSFYLDSSFRDLESNKANDLPFHIHDMKPAMALAQDPCVGHGEANNDSFCILAFNHLHLLPSGTLKLCCIADRELKDDRHLFNVYRDSIDAIWNSSYLRDVRRRMVEGRPVGDCSRCYVEEKLLGTSRRLQQNDYWFGEAGHDRSAVVESSRVNDYAVTDKPSFIQLNMGNLCNLACRMCSSHYSSRIENDPVHSKWMPPTHDQLARWKDGQLILGPRPVVGVDMSGFLPYELLGDGVGIRWTDGNAGIIFPAPISGVSERLLLTLRAPVGTSLRCRVTLNSYEVFFGEVGDTPLTVGPCDVTGLIASQGNIRILSATVGIDGNDKSIGVGLLDVRLIDVAGQTCWEEAFSRFQPGLGWWRSSPFLQNELLSRPESLRHFVLQGGEPLLIAETLKILEYLIKQGVAGQVLLEIVTNLLLIDDAVLEKLLCFDKVVLEASVDGLESVYEYIRYPGKWSVLIDKLHLVRAAKRIDVMFVIAIQAYNLAQIDRYFAFCDENDIAVGAHFLVGPSYLSVLILPVKARSEVVERLRFYLERNSGSRNRASIEYVINFLNKNSHAYDVDLQADFIRFTFDLDKSRGQDARVMVPDVIAALESNGVSWTDQGRFA